MKAPPSEAEAELQGSTRGRAAPTAGRVKRARASRAPGRGERGPAARRGQRQAVTTRRREAQEGRAEVVCEGAGSRGSGAERSRARLERRWTRGGAAAAAGGGGAASEAQASDAELRDLMGHFRKL